MKACPNCKYLWPDEHTGQCVECGNPMAAVEANGSNDLQFRFARQIQEGKRENDMESALKKGRNEGLSIHDRVMDKARDMVVQREEVVYEDA